jgi:hypothetical protein
LARFIDKRLRGCKLQRVLSRMHANWHALCVSGFRTSTRRLEQRKPAMFELTLLILGTVIVLSLAATAFRRVPASSPWSV